MLPPKSNYFEDAEPAASPESPPKEDTRSEKNQDDAQTCQVPKAALGGQDLKPGETVTLQVVQSLEDSYLCKVAGEGEEKEEEPAPQQAPPQQAAAPSPMSGLMQ